MGSDESAGAAWQSADIATSFLDDRRQLFPLLDAQEELAQDLLQRGDRHVARFCDLGAGDGAFAKLIMDNHPHATGVLVDFSEPMLSAAKERLGPYAGRWEAVTADISTPAWRGALSAGNFDTIVSSFCIHHLPDERKRELYAEVFELLQPGGIFLNLEHVAEDGLTEGMFDEHLVKRLIELEQRRVDPRPDSVVEREFRERADAEQDKESAAELQAEWLREVGFERVGIYFKWVALALFGGVKPAARGST